MSNTSMTKKDQTHKDSEKEERFWDELSLLLRLWPFLKEKSWVILIALTLTPVITSLQLFQPYIMKSVIDEHILLGKMDGLLSLGLLYLCAVFGSYIATALYSISLAYVGQNMLKAVSYTHLTLPTKA